jgi:hypothetical protein
MTASKQLAMARGVDDRDEEAMIAMEDGRLHIRWRATAWRMQASGGMT